MNKINYKLSIKKVFPSATSELDKKFFHTLTYTGKLSDQIIKHLKKYKLNFSFKTSKSLQIFLRNNKSKTDKNDKSGVYLKKCGTPNCNNVYIGQTGRSFKSRNTDHKIAYLKNLPEKSHFASHILQSNHDYDNNFDILHTCNKSLKLDLLEAMEINRIKKNSPDLLLNCKLDLNSSPLLNLF